MIQYVKQGWSAAWRQPFAVMMLFLYNLLWGFFLYRFINGILYPLLRQYPGHELGEENVRLFLAEGQFQLIKAGAWHETAWMLAALLAVRMVLTPLLRAGVYYSLHHKEEKQRKRFFAGIRKLGKPFAVLYAVQTLLTIAPLWWLIRHIFDQLFQSEALSDIALNIAPQVIGWLLYAGLLELLFIFLQLSIALEEPLRKTVALTFKHSLTIVGVSLFLLCVAGIAALVTLFGSMIWVGFAAVLIHQLHYIMKAIVQLWEISSQYQLYRDKSV